MLLGSLVAIAPITALNAQVIYNITDLGTLGGAGTSASSISAPAPNASGMIVGASNVSDNSDHAFLWSNGQMFDLNNLCDLSQSGFRVLTVANSINDSCVIIGQGLTTAGAKHAFCLTPIAVAGGQWSYVCCQWCWIPEGEGGIGWWWEATCGCYRWHGPPGRHPACPPENPPCWGFPLPCPPSCQRPPRGGNGNPPNQGGPPPSPGPHGFPIPPNENPPPNPGPHGFPIPPNDNPPGITRVPSNGRYRTPPGTTETTDSVPPKHSQRYRTRTNTGETPQTPHNAHRERTETPGTTTTHTTTSKKTSTGTRGHTTPKSTPKKVKAPVSS